MILELCQGNRRPVLCALLNWFLHGNSRNNLNQSYAGSHWAGPGEIIISATSLHRIIVTEFFQVNSSQLLCIEDLFSETSSLALLAKNVIRGCHKWDRVAGVTQCSDRNSTPCPGISTAIAWSAGSAFPTDFWSTPSSCPTVTALSDQEGAFGRTFCVPVVACAQVLWLPAFYSSFSN